MNSRRLAYVAGAGAAAQLGRDAYKAGKASVNWLQKRKYAKGRSTRSKYYPLYRPLTSYDVKRHLTDIPFTTYSQNVQQYYGLGSISQGTDINQRLRQVIHPICVDIDFVFKNALSFYQVARWCLIQPKGNRDISGTNINNEFFRGSNAIRAVDFDQVFKGSHKMSYPINRDIYKVYAEGTIPLTGTNVADGAVNAGNNIHRMTKRVYFPRGNVILYEGPTTADDQTAPIFIWWLVRPETNSISANEAGAFGPHPAGGHLILHYKEMV